MSRKTKIYVIEEEGRDKGKAFFLKEMPSREGERWANRAIFALANAGVPIANIDDIKNMGWGALVTLGFRALSNIPFEAAEPLLNEMFACVRFVPDPSKSEVVRDLVEGDSGDIDEVATRYRLRREVFDLHAGFLMAELKSKQTSVSAKAA